VICNKVQRAMAAAFCLVVVLFDTACSVTVTPPVHPEHPTVVYLCDYGVHSSLLLPVASTPGNTGDAGPRKYVEYLYGDWNWAALCHTRWWDALGAIFWSRQATLGRRYITQNAGQAMPIPSGGLQTEIPITVNGDGCQKLLDEMSARWEKDVADHPGDQTIVADYVYVKDSQAYSWLHDCNLNTADSLVEMGCTVSGYAIWSRMEVVKR
jgi:hypothetical protein